MACAILVATHLATALPRTQEVAAWLGDGELPVPTHTSTAPADCLGAGTSSTAHLAGHGRKEGKEEGKEEGWEDEAAVKLEAEASGLGQGAGEGIAHSATETDAAAAERPAKRAKRMDASDGAGGDDGVGDRGGNDGGETREAREGKGERGKGCEGCGDAEAAAACGEEGDGGGGGSQKQQGSQKGQQGGHEDDATYQRRLTAAKTKAAGLVAQVGWYAHACTFVCERGGVNVLQSQTNQAPDPARRARRRVARGCTGGVMLEPNEIGPDCQGIVARPRNGCGGG